MARIQFKAKVQTVYNMDNTVAYRYVQVPAFDRKHCDMHAFRTHPKYGSYANSDLFHGMLRRIRDEKFPWSVNGARAFKMDEAPKGVECDASGFLAVVSVEV
jgi:hypothetical protein